MNWTDERIEQLRKLWEDGWGCSYIGVQMGISRSAVIGKVHRMGFHQTVNRKINPEAGPQAYAARKPRVRKVKSFFTGWKSVRLEEVEPYIPSASDVVTVGMDIMLLDDSRCRYPEGDGPFLFCGLPVKPEKPYCPSHCRIAYTPARERKDRSPKTEPRSVVRHIVPACTVAA